MTKLFDVEFDVDEEVSVEIDEEPGRVGNLERVTTQKSGGSRMVGVEVG